MKSYLQGLITGGVFVFAFMVLTANQNSSLEDFISSIEESDKQRKDALLKEPKTGKSQMIIDKHARPFLFDTQTGAYYTKSPIGRTSVDVNGSGVWNVNPIVPAHGFIVEN